ncbi:hypothetical protein MHBO_002502, partial [Bonamia ostreae]
ILQMVNYICKILSLDKSISDNVLTLKRSLLKLLSIPLFSPDAIFSDPGQSFVLQDIVCSYCADCTQIDLCKTPTALSREWLCVVCSHDIDLSAIENAVNGNFWDFVFAFITQDLVCKRCKRPKNLYLDNVCKCSGQFELKVSKREFEEKRDLFSKIANFYNFELLKESIEQSNFVE